MERKRCATQEKSQNDCKINPALLSNMINNKPGDQKLLLTQA